MAVMVIGSGVRVPATAHQHPADGGHGPAQVSGHVGHAGHGAPAGIGPVASTTREEDFAAADVPSGEPQPCEDCGSQGCCPALSACATSLAAATELRVTAAAPAGAERTVATDADAPTSTIGGPEPPPPRA